MALRDRRLSALAFFVALALVHTWPLVSAPATLSRTDTADTQLNLWILAWVAHALASSPLELFNANIFHPEPRTLAFSEHLFVPALFGAPVVWAGGSIVLAHNVVLWSGLALTGWTTSLVLHRWTGDWWAALMAGSLAAFNTATLTSMSHVQAMHVEFLPLAMLALDDVLSEGRRRDAVRLGVFAALQMLCSGYLLVMTAVSLVTGTLARPSGTPAKLRLKPPRCLTSERLRFAGVPVSAGPAPRGGHLPRAGGTCFIRHDVGLGRCLGPRWRSRLSSLGLAALIMLTLCAPFLYQYYRAQHDQGLTRSYEEVGQFAGVWQNFLATGARVHFATWAGPFYLQSNSAAFPGVLPLLLTLVALATGVAWRNPRARMWLCIGLVGAALSFGPKLPGYWLLYEGFPLLQGIRAVARFSLLALLAVAVLAAFGLAWTRARLAASRRPWTASAAGALALVIVNAENARLPMAFVPFHGIPPIYATLAGEEGAVVAELPFPEPLRIGSNAAYVLASTEHWRPLLNGYSGFVPESYTAHYLQFKDFPDPSVIEHLRHAGVTHIVVHLSQAPGAVAALQRVPGVSLFAATDAVRIYTIGTRIR